jgi:tRNA(Ile)-lysidine synthase
MSKLAKTLQNIETFISARDLIRDQERVLVAISGGPDSVFLAYALHHLHYPIGLAHINYQLRGETSEYEEKLVIQYAQTWGVPIYHRRMKAHQKEAESSSSKQVIYRDFRYDFFTEIMTQHHYQVCATAHHRGDQAESILMSLTRGNHPAMIQSIPVQREQFVRPLLNLSKQEILDCIAEAGLTYSHDISNDSNDYLRNQFRNQVIPLLTEINPSIEAQLVWKHDWYQSQFTFIKVVLDQQADAYLSESPQVKRLHFTPFIAQFGREFLPLLNAWALERWGIYGHYLWESLKLIDSDPGRFILTDKGRISKGRDTLILETEEVKEEIQEITAFLNQYIVRLGSQTIHFSINEEKPDFNQPNTFWLDRDKIQFPLRLRRWQPGDRMTPLGMKHAKKLSDIFIDEKLDSAQKKRAIVFESAGQIVALYPFRVANQVKLSAHTQKTLKIVIED